MTFLEGRVMNGVTVEVTKCVRNNGLYVSAEHTCRYRRTVLVLFMNCFVNDASTPQKLFFLLASSVAEHVLLSTNAAVYCITSYL